MTNPLDLLPKVEEALRSLAYFAVTMEGDMKAILENSVDPKTKIASWNTRVREETKTYAGVRSPSVEDHSGHGEELRGSNPAPAPTQQPVEETSVAMLQRLGMDGRLWAQAFHRTALKLGYSAMDEGWLIGWFCNAVMAGYDEAKRRATEWESSAPAKEMRSERAAQLLRIGYAKWAIPLGERLPTGGINRALRELRKHANITEKESADV